MAKIVILSCTKSKLDHKAPAQELYSASPMFKKTLEYGKSLNPDKMFILSAKHNLVPLNKELEDVTQRIINVPKEEVAARLEKMTKSLTEVKLDNDTWLCLYTGEVFCK